MLPTAKCGMKAISKTTVHRGGSLRVLDEGGGEGGWEEEREGGR